MDWFAGMGESNVAEFGAALEGRNALEQFVEAATPGMLDATPEIMIEVFRSFLSPVDAAVVTESLTGYLFESTRVGIREKRDGWVDDDLAFVQAWGFDLAQIRIPVMLMHGEQDRFVPYSHGKWLANRIPAVHARLLPGDGHLTLAAYRIPDVHAWLLSKM